MLNWRGLRPRSEHSELRIQHSEFFQFSPLHSTRCISACQRVHFRDGHAIEVSRYRLLQRARRDGEPQRGVVGTAGDETVNQSSGEAVAAADAIDEPHAVSLAL